ncbi:hypothetical protein AB1N83_010988 [Pleurotus pulmonarius]|nr:hypothetical protein EYR36_010578 [Pleurotus pulmonarius]
MASSTSSPPTSPRDSSDDIGVLPASSPNTSTSTNASLKQVRATEMKTKPHELKEPPLTQSRRVADTISAPFVPFDAETALVQPFQEETNRDTVFERELTSMLLDIMLEFHAWSASRPRGQSEHSGKIIEQRIGKVMSIEMEQGRSSTSTALSRAYSLPFPFLRSTLIEDTRRRLSDFIKQVKLALDALTGTRL